MSYSTSDLPFVLTKDPINLDEERMFRSFHGGLSPDEYIDKHQLKLPYPVRNCTPEIKAALALEGFEAYDPDAPRYRTHEEHNQSEMIEERDMEAALAMLAAGWSQVRNRPSPTLVGDERKAVNDPLPVPPKELRTRNGSQKFEGPRRENLSDAANSRLQGLIGQQMVSSSPAIDTEISGGSKYFLVG